MKFGVVGQFESGIICVAEIPRSAGENAGLWNDAKREIPEVQLTGTEGQESNVRGEDG